MYLFWIYFGTGRGTDKRCGERYKGCTVVTFVNISRDADTMMGDLNAANHYGPPSTTSTLGAGISESHDFTRDIQPGDPNPLYNEVTFYYEADCLSHSEWDWYSVA